MNNYQIITAKRTVHISANTEWEAKALFQERFGYWPDDSAVTLI